MAKKKRRTQVHENIRSLECTWITKWIILLVLGIRSFRKPRPKENCCVHYYVVQEYIQNKLSTFNWVVYSCREREWCVEDVTCWRWRRRKQQLYPIRYIWVLFVKYIICPIHRRYNSQSIIFSAAKCYQQPTQTHHTQLSFASSFIIYFLWFSSLECMAHKVTFSASFLIPAFKHSTTRYYRFHWCSKFDWVEWNMMDWTRSEQLKNVSNYYYYCVWLLRCIVEADLWRILV